MNGSGEIFRGNDDGTYEVLVRVRGGRKTKTVSAEDIEVFEGRVREATNKLREHVGRFMKVTLREEGRHK